MNRSPERADLQSIETAQASITRDIQRVIRNNRFLVEQGLADKQRSVHVPTFEEFRHTLQTFLSLLHASEPLKPEDLPKLQQPQAMMILKYRLGDSFDAIELQPGMPRDTDALNEVIIATALEAELGIQDNYALMLIGQTGENILNTMRELFEKDEVYAKNDEREWEVTIDPTLPSGKGYEIDYDPKNVSDGRCRHGRLRFIKFENSPLLVTSIHGSFIGVAKAIDHLTTRLEKMGGVAVNFASWGKALNYWPRFVHEFPAAS